MLYFSSDKENAGSDVEETTGATSPRGLDDNTTSPRSHDDPATSPRGPGGDMLEEGEEVIEKDASEKSEKDDHSIDENGNLDLVRQD